MDLNKLRIQVFEKTSIKIDTNDPIFALVALNEAVLSECVDQHISGLQSATEQLREQTTQLIEAGDRAKKLLLQMGHAVEDPTAAFATKEIQSETTSTTQSSWRLVAAAGGVSVFSAVLALGGQAALISQRASAPIAPNGQTNVQALTPEQLILIQNGSKYAKMWPKLDPKTQEKIQVLSQ
jgi:hypothetical protein